MARGSRGQLHLALLAAACGLGIAFSPAMPSLRAYGPSCGTGLRLAFPQVVPPRPRTTHVRHLRALGEKTKNDLAVGAQAAETISRRASILRAQAGSYTPRDAVLRPHACWPTERGVRSSPLVLLARWSGSPK